MRQTLKTILISFLVSLNVCVWRETLGLAFDRAVLVVLGFLLGLMLYGLVYNRKD